MHRPGLKTHQATLNQNAAKWGQHEAHPTTFRALSSKSSQAELPGRGQSQ